MFEDMFNFISSWYFLGTDFTAPNNAFVSVDFRFVRCRKIGSDFRGTELVLCNYMFDITVVAICSLVKLELPKGWVCRTVVVVWH